MSLRVAVVGPEEFAQSLVAQGAEACLVDWRPPSGGSWLVKLALEPALMERVDAANFDALHHVLEARSVLTAVRPAGDVVPGLSGRMLLHAGPPLDWPSASGPMRGAMIGATILEGWAETPERAASLISASEIELSPCHEHDVVGPMAGIVSPSMPVFVVRNETAGNLAYSTINEGLGRVLRYGAYDQSVLDHLRWLETVAGPAIGSVLESGEGIDLTSLVAQALQMGDELHNRNKAATALFTRSIAPRLVAHEIQEQVGSGAVESVLAYLAQTDVFFLNLAMAACKAALDAAGTVEGSTLVTAMARNGTDFGIRVSGTGSCWFTAPAPEIEGLFFPGFGSADANPDLGDSAITETGGLGGFALAAAPAIAQFVGGSASLGRKITEEMYEITLAQHPVYQIPAMDFRGTPVGIDAALVCRTGITPVLDTGIAHREPGIGQIGAGIVRVPVRPFADALAAVVSSLG